MVMNRIYAKSNETINEKLVQESIGDILKENEFYYQHLLQIYPRGQVKLIKAIAKEGTVKEIENNDDSVIGGYLSGKQKPTRNRCGINAFANGEIRMETDQIHTVKPLSVRIPMGGLTVITGVSGSGNKTCI